MTPIAAMFRKSLDTILGVLVILYCYAVYYLCFAGVFIWNWLTPLRHLVFGPRLSRDLLRLIENELEGLTPEEREKAMAQKWLSSDGFLWRYRDGDWRPVFDPNGPVSVSAHFNEDGTVTTVDSWTDVTGQYHREERTE